MAKLIEPSRGLGYSDIYLDFVSGLHKARHFYSPDSLHSVASRVDTVAYDRNRLVEILRRQNGAWGGSEQTMAAIESLRDPRAVCVFAGQQAGLFSGPLLVQIKALAVVKSARTYAEMLGRPVVPIFWIAGDDHDFEEVNHTFVLDRKTSEPVRLSYSSAPEKPLPVGEVEFSDTAALDGVKSRLREVLGETDFTPDLYALIDRCYAPGETFVSAFAKFMTALMGQFGLVLFSPADAGAKEAVARFFHELIDKQDQVRSLIAEANEHLTEQGYHIQVEKKERSAHLFCHLDGRLPVVREDLDQFMVGERRFSVTELKRLVDSDPSCFSPDVMTRPVMQSWLFPVISQKGGPSEIAYFAQVNPLFSLFSRVAPCHVARATASFVERHNEKLMHQYGISFEELTGDVEQVVNRVVAQSFPQDLQERFEELRRSVESEFQDFVDRAKQVDPQLESVASTIQGKIDHNLKQFEGKVFSAHKRKFGETRDRIHRLAHTLYTNRGLQERSLNITYFLAKYGFGFLPYAYEQLDSEETSHQLISLSDYRS